MRFILAAIIALTLASPSVAENPDAKARMKLADRVMTSGKLIWTDIFEFYFHKGIIYKCWSERDPSVSKTPYLQCEDQEVILKGLFQKASIELYFNGYKPYLEQAKKVFKYVGSDTRYLPAYDDKQDLHNYRYFLLAGQVYICSEAPTTNSLLCKLNSDPSELPY